MQPTLPDPLAPVSGVPPSCFLWIGSLVGHQPSPATVSGGRVLAETLVEGRGRSCQTRAALHPGPGAREGGPSARRSCCFLSCSARPGPGGIISTQQGWFCFVPQSLAHMLEGC